MVAVELDGNYIDAEPVKSRTAKALTKAYQAIFQRWQATGAVSPNWHMLDSEAPEELKKAIRANKCRVELTPADQHRRNAAERAIQTFKGHFIAVLAGVDSSFPINQWDELLPQTVLTLNLLRQSNVAPNISAWAYHHGSFDYNRMPLAPMGCAVQFHIKPSRRKTFGEHSEDGFYLKTSEEHYRTHIIFVKKTRAKRLADTVFFKHKYITQPTITPADAIVNAFNKLRQTIHGIQHSKEDAQYKAIERIMQQAQQQPIQQAEQVNIPRVERELTEQVPRVRFAEEPASPKEPQERLIVAWPKEQIVQPSKSPTPKPKPILKRPTYIAKPDSIAERVKAKRQQPETTQTESIAERVARRRRERKVEVAHAVLDQETGQLLEYRQLLKHPRFKELWNRSGAGNLEEKKDPYRTRATMGGNLINYPDDVGTPTANMLLVKIFLNSVISTRGARFANADIANFYLMTPLKRPEYAKIRLSNIPEEIMEEYNLREKATPDGWVYIKVIRGMYGLPQAGSLGHDLLEQRLNAEGYFQSKIVPGLWKHEVRPIMFALVVDDFGIKYTREEDLDHLIESIKKHYDVTVDKDGKEYLKIEIDWDYKNRKVHLSMKPYLEKALRQFDNLVPTQRRDSPHPHVEPKYGAKQQFAEYDTSEPPAVLTYRASDMILAIHSDASYLNESNARSRAGGHHFLSEDVTNPPNNGPIYNEASIIKGVMSSAAEAELGSLYMNARKGVEERNILEEMGHPQPATPVQVDNSTADGIVNSRVQPKRTKAMDMRFHWLRDRAINQNQFRFYWRPGHNSELIIGPNITLPHIIAT
eukprot:CCRYP_017928-RA/>CCRYP_017928-RA protein AED:0.26 eAED:0.26 QI:0/0/0/1/1/1/3/0/814